MMSTIEKIDNAIKNLDDLEKVEYLKAIRKVLVAMECIKSPVTVVN